MRVKSSREIMGLDLAMVIGAFLYCPSPFIDMEASLMQILACDVIPFVSKPPRCVAQGYWSEPFKFQDDLLSLAPDVVHNRSLAPDIVDSGFSIGLGVVSTLSSSRVTHRVIVTYFSRFTSLAVALLIGGVGLGVVSMLSSGRVDSNVKGVAPDVGDTLPLSGGVGRYRVGDNLRVLI
ncbi:hypothetical protein QCA50_005266 [Cerrena zonata]|uniref:Uncharacterized protein n=1 Tax=Cerrena zonata TaxID=2478898 RepID=A0AAW0GJ35_9APHY